MGFPLNLLNVSLLHGGLLLTLWIKLLLSPDYNWPSDYLDRATNCNPNFPFPGVNRSCDNACDLSVKGTLPVFDYIIVGSGAAGSLIAYRLTLAHPSRKVLLIEAGADPILDSVPPPLFEYNFNNSAFYNFSAENSPKYGNAFKNGVNCYCGKSMGGSTEINAMMFVCGCDKNYNHWAAATNDSSWNYMNILPYIKKSHRVQDPTGSLLAGNCGNYQGTSGPIIVTNADSTSDFITPILKKATKELNFPEKSSANCGPPFTGFANIPMTIYNGQRESAARALLVPLSNNGNFYFMRNSVVTKVLTSKDATGTWTATGVNVNTKLTKCPSIDLQASREVIISAGSYNSPLILQRSGIGKTSDFSTCGITQIKDLPVGRNLMDHAHLVGFWTIPGFTSTDFQSTTYFSGQIFPYIIDYTGYFSRIQGINYGGFINTLNDSKSCPDIQIAVSRYEQNMVDMSILMNDKWSYKPEFANQILNANKNSAIIQVYVILLNPKSRGTVKLGSCTDPYAQPIIDGNYFNDPSDLHTLVRGMQTVCKIFNTNAAKTAKINPLIFDIADCNSLKFCSDSYIRCYSKYFSANMWHPSGTCKMGSSSNDSVVDNRLKVFGVKHLRVADASIMPVITSGNTQCPTYTIGEKAADMILADNP